MLPSTLRAIGNMTFMGCVQLRKVSLPAELRELGASCFEGSGIEEVTIPRRARAIGERVFTGCKSLATVTFPLDSALEEISVGAFQRTAITSFQAPDSLRHIGAEAFKDCKRLQNAVLNEHLSTLGENCFQNTQLKKVVIPRDVVEIS